MPKILLKIKELEWGPFVMVAILLGAAPFAPQPHLVEKIQFLINGTLSKPIDIFDLFFHSSLPLFLLLKAFVHWKTNDWKTGEEDKRPSYMKSSPLDEDESGNPKNKPMGSKKGKKK